MVETAGFYFFYEKFAIRKASKSEIAHAWV